MDCVVKTDGLYLLYISVECTSLCTQHKTYVGFFYMTQLEECIGCRADFQSRTTTITDTEYYTCDGTLGILLVYIIAI